MTIKEIEILIANDYLMDMLVYARCQLNDLGVSFNLPDLRFERSKLFSTLKNIQDEVSKLNPTYNQISVFRREYHK